MKEHLLFICSRNQWRSPTAELLFKNHSSYTAKSAGTSAKARIRISEKLIAWADYIVVMERKHKDLIKARYTASLAGKPIITLHIEDHYRYNDPEMIQILKEKIASELMIHL
jgi:predicted protein tyrosine phosphatase